MPGNSCCSYLRTQSARYLKKILFLFLTSTFTPATKFTLTSFFFYLFLPLSPLPKKGYPCTHLSTLRGESLEPSFLEHKSSSGCKIHPYLIALVQKNSFSGLSYENPTITLRGGITRYNMSLVTLAYSLMPSPKAHFCLRV